MTVLDDLETFVRLEIAGNDIEPWAEIIGSMHYAGLLDEEQTFWAIKLYNAYDDLGSAWKALDRWPNPTSWQFASNLPEAAAYPCSRERRNLRGGKIIKHLDSYVDHLSGEAQGDWINRGLLMDSRGTRAAHPQWSFGPMMRHMRRVWGVGRQTAFEWAEFCYKAMGTPVETPDAYLWESSGPRESIESLYGLTAPSEDRLNNYANECKAMLADAGLELSWWDFETVICDFNVMRKGRYYPGAHIAMLREEIEGLPDPARANLYEAFLEVIPEPWSAIPAGFDKALGRAYRETGIVPDLSQEAWV